METLIAATANACFDLARDTDVHAQTTSSSRERVVAGKKLLELGDTVTFEAIHLGFRQRLTSRITRFEPPGLFEDTMARGIFRSFVHLHEFFEVPGGVTRMVDTLDYVSPLGKLGRMADRLFLHRYLKRLLQARAFALKAFAERA